MIKSVKVGLHRRPGGTTKATNSRVSLVKTHPVLPEGGTTQLKRRIDLLCDNLR